MPQFASLAPAFFRSRRLSLAPPNVRRSNQLASPTPRPFATRPRPSVVALQQRMMGCRNVRRRPSDYDVEQPSGNEDDLSGSASSESRHCRVGQCCDERILFRYVARYADLAPHLTIHLNYELDRIVQRKARIE